MSKVPEMYVLKFEFEFRGDVLHICCERDNLIASEIVLLVQNISGCELSWGPEILRTI